MRVCVGQILGPHGVRGLVKLASFTAEPDAVAAYGPLSDDGGQRSFEIALLGRQKSHWLARVTGIDSREQAESLSGQRLYAPRDRLPPADEGEFYQTDLIGLAVEDLAGVACGRVVALHNFGAGDLLEFESTTGRREMLPFTKAAVPVIDIPGGRVVIDRPTEIEAEGGA